VTPGEQHLATRSAAGLFDFSFMGLFEFSSERALGEAQTRALYGMVPGQVAYTLLLNEDGGVFNDATVWQMGGERYWLWTGRRTDVARIRGVARDRSGEFAVLALQGPRSGVILETIIGRPAVRSLRYFHFFQKESMLVARLGYSGELGYELIVPAAERDGLWTTLARAGAAECGTEAMNSLRIEAGYVLFDREIDGKVNPRELGLERLVVPARPFPLREKLVGLEILDKVSSGPPARLTSECFSPTLNRQIGLGFVPPAASGDVRVADGRTARIASLPFYDPERQRPRAAPL
jgi:aminomethyltransferase